MESDVTQSANWYKFLAWLEVNKKQVIYGVVGAMVLGLVIWFYVWNKEQQRLAAGEAFSEVFVPLATGASPKSAAAASYLKMASAYPKSAAAARAQLLAAANLFTEGKFAEAQAQFEKFAREQRENPLVGQAQFGIAACLDAQGKTNEAATAYKTLIDRRSAESVIPQAKFALGRLYLAQGNPEAAYQIFEGLAMDERFSSIGSEAGMRAEELRAKYPQLAPKPEAPAPAGLSMPIVISNTPPTTSTPPTGTSATVTVPATTNR